MEVVLTVFMVIAAFILGLLIFALTVLFALGLFILPISLVLHYNARQKALAADLPAPAFRASLIEGSKIGGIVFGGVLFFVLIVYSLWGQYTGVAPNIYYEGIRDIIDQ